MGHPGWINATKHWPSMWKLWGQRVKPFSFFANPKTCRSGDEIPVAGSPVAFWGIPQATHSEYQLACERITNTSMERRGWVCTPHFVMPIHCLLSTLSFLLSSPFVIRLHRSPPHCFAKSLIGSASTTQKVVGHKHLICPLRKRKEWSPKHKSNSHSSIHRLDFRTGEKPFWEC